MGKRKPAFQKKKTKKAPFIIIFAVVIISCGYLVIRGISLQNTRAELQEEINALNSQIDNENERTEELKEQETYMHTKKYAEEVAKDVLGYVYEDEVIFKPEK